ncbi:hypothetical protein D3C73_1218730 [compost metagenome]
MFGDLKFVPRQPQLAFTATQNEHARVRYMVHMRQQLVAHGTVALMPAAVVAHVIEQHQFFEKCAAQAQGLHVQPCFVAGGLGKQWKPGRRCRRNRDALVAGQCVGRAIFHQPGTKPSVAVLRAIHRTPLDFVVHRYPRESAGLQRQPMAGVVFV